MKTIIITISTLLAVSHAFWGNPKPSQKVVSNQGCIAESYVSSIKHCSDSGDMNDAGNSDYIDSQRDRTSGGDYNSDSYDRMRDRSGDYWGYTSQIQPSNLDRGDMYDNKDYFSDCDTHKNYEDKYDWDKPNHCHPSNPFEVSYLSQDFINNTCDCGGNDTPTSQDSEKNLSYKEVVLASASDYTENNVIERYDEEDGEPHGCTDLRDMFYKI